MTYSTIMYLLGLIGFGSMVAFVVFWLILMAIEIWRDFR